MVPAPEPMVVPAVVAHPHLAAALVVPWVTTSQVVVVVVATPQFLVALPISSKPAAVEAAGAALKRAVVVLAVEVEAQLEPNLPKMV